MKKKQPLSVPCPIKDCTGSGAVTDSRLQYGVTRTRRRQCRVCQHRWTTVEISQDRYRELLQHKNQQRD